MLTFFSRLDADKISIHLLNGIGDYSCVHNRWTCILKKNAEGVKLEINVTASTPEAAVEEAYAKYSRTVNEGSKELRSLELEYEAPPAPRSLDDEIPF
jgi:hypothetical protein